MSIVKSSNEINQQISIIINFYKNQLKKHMEFDQLDQNELKHIIKTYYEKKQKTKTKTKKTHMKLFDKTKKDIANYIYHSWKSKHAHYLSRNILKSIKTVKICSNEEDKYILNIFYDHYMFDYKTFEEKKQTFIKLLDDAYLYVKNAPFNEKKGRIKQIPLNSKHIKNN